MPNFNQVILAGNLTRDPELRYLPSGSAVCEANLAVSEKYKDKNGEKQEKTCFIELVIWAQSGERFAEWFRKGENLLISGKLEFDQWNNDAGEKRSKHKINVRTFERCGSSKKQDSQPVSTSGSVPGFENQQEIPVGDDVPF